MDKIILIEIVIYFSLMLLIGVYFSLKKINYDEYLLGGDKIPGWVLALSERSTEASAWLLLGATGFAYSTGLSSVWLFLGMLGGIIVSWLLLAKRFMLERKKYGAITLPDYLSLKFPNHGKVIRLLGSLIIVPFFTFYIGAQLGGAGGTIEQVIGIDPLTGILILSGIVIIYSFLGGFLSVVWTDAVQALIMIATLVIVPAVALYVIFSQGISLNEELAAAGNGINSWTGGSVGFGLGLLIYTNLSWGLGYLGGQPHISARFMALSNENEVKKGRMTGIIWGGFAYGGAFLLGISGIVIYGTGHLDNPELILPFMLSDLLPSWLVGILISGVLAAIMSTASSQLLVVTSSVCEDLLKNTFKINLSEKKMVLISRLTVIIVGLVGLIIGLSSEMLIYVIVGWAWAGVGNSFAAAILLTFFWKKTSGAGVVAALAAGFISSIIWINTGLEELFTSRGATLIIALLAGVIVSILVPEKNEEKSLAEAY